ncbi:MAG: hypothetical protein HEQ23_02650 [Tepidisphaera sp.]
MLSHILRDRGLANCLAVANRESKQIRARWWLLADAAISCLMVLAISLASVFLSDDRIAKMFVAVSVPLAIGAIVARSRVKSSECASDDLTVELSTKSLYFDAGRQISACVVFRPWFYFMDLCFLLQIFALAVYPFHWSAILIHGLAIIVVVACLMGCSFMIEKRLSVAQRRFAKRLCILCGYDVQIEQSGLITCSECGRLTPLLRADPETPKP